MPEEERWKWKGWLQVPQRLLLEIIVPLRHVVSAAHLCACTSELGAQGAEQGVAHVRRDGRGQLLVERRGLENCCRQFSLVLVQRPVDVSLLSPIAPARGQCCNFPSNRRRRHQL